MWRQERLAHDLLSQLQAQDVDAVLEHADGNWQVVWRGETRSALVVCRNFADPSRALEMVGARGNVHLDDRFGPPTVDSGPQYDVLLSVADDHQRGCTEDLASAIAAIVAWSRGAPHSQIGREHPFVGREARFLAAIEDAVLEDHPDALVLDGPPARAAFHLGARSVDCRVTADPVSRLVFRSLGAPLARGGAASAPQSAQVIAQWLGGVPVGQFDLPGLHIDRHADLFEEARYSEWGWAHHLDTARAGDTALALHLDLLEGLAASGSLSAFFAFTSRSTLCLSRCSHFPFDTAGLPRMTPRREGGWTVVWGDDRFEGNLDTVIGRLEAGVPRRPDPYLGNLNVRLAPLLVEALKGTGLSVRRPHPQPQADVLVGDGSEDRDCIVRPAIDGGPGRIVFRQSGRRAGEANPSGLHEAVELLSDWLRARVAIDDLAAAAADWRGFGSVPPTE
jgi:hypothetical protein